MIIYLLFIIGIKTIFEELGGSACLFGLNTRKPIHCMELLHTIGHTSNSWKNCPLCAFIATGGQIPIGIQFVPLWLRVSVLGNSVEQFRNWNKNLIEHLRTWATPSNNKPLVVLSRPFLCFYHVYSLQHIVSSTLACWHLLYFFHQAYKYHFHVNLMHMIV